MVVAFPRNFRVIAFNFAGFEIFKHSIPRSIAVLRSACSACSKPRRNRTGSVSWMFTLMPPPEATGFSSATDFTLLIMLLADARPEDQCDSAIGGLGTPEAVIVPPIAPTAPPAEFLVSNLISSTPESGKEATELRLLMVVLVDDQGVDISVVSGLEEKWVSMKDHRKRLALSRGTTSFSVKYDLLVVCRRWLRGRVESSATYAI